MCLNGAQKKQKGARPTYCQKSASLSCLRRLAGVAPPERCVHAVGTPGYTSKECPATGGLALAGRAAGVPCKLHAGKPLRELAGATGKAALDDRAGAPSAATAGRWPCTKGGTRAAGNEAITTLRVGVEQVSAGPCPGGSNCAPTAARTGLTWESSAEIGRAAWAGAPKSAPTLPRTY